MKAWFGGAATKENNWAFDYLPKLDKGYDVLQAFELMGQGKINGYICQGFNPVASFPNKAKISAGLAKLKFLVVIDPLATETSEFWKNFGVVQRCRSDEDPDRGLPPAVDLLCRGGRLAHQFRTLAAVALEGRGAAGRGERRSGNHRRHLHAHSRDVREGWRRVSRPDRQSDLAVQNPASPAAEELAMEYNGKALADVLAPLDPKNPKDPPKVLVPAGQQVPSFAFLRDDGTTSCGCWIYSGAWTQAGNQMARRDNSDPLGHRPDAELGVGVAGQPPHPLQPRIVRSGGQVVEPEAQARVLERQGVGRLRRARHAPRRGARRGRRSVHHDGRRRGEAVRAQRPGRRAAARALRAVRVAGAVEPDVARTIRRRSPIRRRACSRATWKRSASRRTSRTRRRPIA